MYTRARKADPLSEEKQMLAHAGVRYWMFPGELRWNCSQAKVKKIFAAERYVKQIITNFIIDFGVGEEGKGVKKISEGSFF